MSKTVIGVKELAQRELAKQTRAGKAARAFHYEGTDPVPVLDETMDGYHERVMASRKVKARIPPGRKPGPKKRELIPYAGKPRVGADHGIFGVKPGPKAQRKAAARKKLK